MTSTAVRRPLRVIQGHVVRSRHPHHRRPAGHL